MIRWWLEKKKCNDKLLMMKINGCVYAMNIKVIDEFILFYIVEYKIRKKIAPPFTIADVFVTSLISLDAFESNSNAWN